MDFCGYRNFKFNQIIDTKAVSGPDAMPQSDDERIWLEFQNLATAMVL